MNQHQDHLGAAYHWQIPEEKGLREMSQTPKATKGLLVKKEEHDESVEGGI